MSGSRAAKRKKIQNPILGSSEPTLQEKRRLHIAISEPRWISTLCFAVAGLLAGLFTGFNHFPNLAAIDGISQTMLLGAYLGDPKLDIVNGITTAFAGLMIGGCLGFSAFSDHLDMGLSILLSTGLAIVALVFTGNLWLVGVGFLVGHLPAFNAYRRLEA